MTAPDTLSPPLDDTPPAPRLRASRGPSLVWLVPIIALAVGVSIVVRNVLSTGPRVTIEFNSANGIKPGKTEVRYKEVVVGRVDAVAIGSDAKRVQVSVQLDRSAAGLAVDDTNFWVVRPRIELAGVSGLETLFSGAYIGVDAGSSAESRRRFSGLEAPPLVLRGEPGRSFVLRTPDLGSLDVGSPIFYRRTRVGRVVGYRLDPESDELSVQIFVDSPYERLVSAQTRFWNASGIDVSLTASGLSINTQTLSSILAGGVAFERPHVDRPEAERPGDSTPPSPAPDGHSFRLFADRKSAQAPADGHVLRVRMRFEQTVRGLNPGASVDFMGVDVGTVRSLAPLHEAAAKSGPTRFPIEVQADLYPERLGTLRSALIRGHEGPAQDMHMLTRLVENGLRAQTRSASMISDQLYIALDFMPHAPRAVLDTRHAVPALPTVTTSSFGDLPSQMGEVLAKVNRLPIERIGNNLDSTLSQASEAIKQLKPEAQHTLAEVQRTLVAVQASLGKLDRNVLEPTAPLQRNVEQTLVDLQRAAQSLRTLTDYLARHPESLLRGKAADPVVGGK